MGAQQRELVSYLLLVSLVCSPSLLTMLFARMQNVGSDGLELLQASFGQCPADSRLTELGGVRPSSAAEVMSGFGNPRTH